MKLHPILEKGRVRTGMFATTEDYGFNGAFVINHEGEELRIIASDGLGWQP